MKSIISKTILSFALFSFGHIAAAQDESEATSAAAPVASESLQIENQSDQERIDMLLNVADVYLKDGDLASAGNAYERVLEIDPQNKQARYILATVYISSKQDAKAEALLKALIEEYPKDYQLKNNLAWFYATADDPAYRNGEQAIKLAQEAMVEAPFDHHVWSTLAEAYYVTGQYEKAYRDIKHMAFLAARYGKNLSKETMDDYNEQIRKCKRAWDSEQALNGEDQSGEEEGVILKPETDTAEPEFSPEN